ncbi:MAG: TrlF family AAA-like ATPase, partial [Methanosarcinaceae archaeon]
GIFKELRGRNLEEFLKNDAFQRKVLGLQKSRSYDNRKKLDEILGENVPAFVEGSDDAHKGIEGIGTGIQKTYFKLGAFNFYALKFAFLDKDYRIAPAPPETKNGYIKSVTFNGGKLDGTTIYFNHSMNNLIGIRGSGKSSILESIRYFLDINITEENNLDWEYKTKLVNSTIGSGGKVVMEIVDDHGNEYRAEKILGESTTIHKGEEMQYGLKASAIIAKPVYFGQKDLSKIGSSLSTEYLMNNLIGERITEQKRLIDNKSQEIYSILSEIKKIDKNLDMKPDIEAKKDELVNNLQKFKDYKIDKKLEKQIGFNKDANHIKRVREFEENVLASVDELIEEYKESFETFTKYESKENQQLFKKLYESFESFQNLFGQIEDISKRLIAEHKTFQHIEDEFQKRSGELKEKFAEIKREIKLPNIQPDDYVKFTKDLDLTNAKLKEIEKLAKKKATSKTRLKKALTELQQLWHKEFEIIKDEIDRINKEQKSIKISVEFKGNKSVFKSYLKNNLKGSGLRDNNIKTIVNEYNDLIEVNNDLEKKESKLKDALSGGSQLLSFQEYFNSNLAAFLTFRVPDQFEIIYRGRPLNEHSLGQRASALIIFLLTLKDSHLIIIDQPEDDLDNQTIYDDVIKALKNLKNDTQFIFATHNPNIPVLGDCEQIISCRYVSEKIQTNQGSIDEISIRNDIVDIMEGGEEAFNKRKGIYELWKH